MGRPVFLNLLLCLSSQAGWKESHAIFMTELRNLQAVGLTTFGQSLRNAFDLLNLNRLVSGIDNYGQVRYLIRGVSRNVHESDFTELPGSFCDHLRHSHENVPNPNLKC